MLLTLSLALAAAPEVPAAALAVRSAPALHASASQADEAEEAYRYLAGLVERELWDLAVEAGEAFLREHARDERAPLARYRLATALFALARHADALPHWTQLAEREGFEYRAEAAFRAGECALALDRPADAAPRFAAVLEGEQAYLHEAAGFLLGEAWFRAGEFARADAAYAAHLERFPAADTAADARRARAWCAWESGEPAAAVEHARAFLARHEGDDDADEVRVLLGEALLETDAPEAALEAFRGVSARGDRGDSALRGAGFALAALGRPSEAARAFGIVLERFPESRHARECRLQAGAQALAAGEAARALEYLQPLAADGDAEGCLWAGRAHEALGDDEAALAAYERGLAAGPDDALAERLHVARGDALGALGRVDEARAAYGRGGSDYALHAAAVAALNDGDPAEAARLAEALLARGEDVAYRGPTLLVLGEARFADERWEAAEAAFTDALAAAEDDAARTRARSRLAWCRYMQADPRAAAERFASLASEHPGAPEAEEAARMAARAYEEAGERGAAAAAWRAYLDRYTDGTHALEAHVALARTTDDPAERARALAAAAAADTGSAVAARALFDLAEDLLDAGETEAAAQRYEELLGRVDDGDELAARARYGLAWCRFEAERYADAGALLAPLAEGPRLGALRALDQDLAGAAVELCAWALARAERPAEAQAAVRALVDDPALLPDAARRVEATRAVADAWARAGEPARGQALLAALVPTLGDADAAVEALVEATFLALDAGDLDGAEAQLRAATARAEAAPSVLEASFFVAEARLAAGAEERALELYAAATREGSPLAADALYKRGFVLLARDANAEAAAQFARLVEEHADSPLLGEALFLLGEARFRGADYAGAAAPLARVLDEQPRHEVRPKALFRLGLALGHLERWEEAAERLATLAREAPEFPNLAEAELWRGRALARLAQRRPARGALERVLQLDGGALAAEARVELGRLLQDEDRHEDALSEYLKVAVLYAHPPAVSEALYRAGVALEALGRPDDARARYREVLDAHGESAWAEPARAALARLDR